MITVRPATDADVRAMSAVMTASIRDLCAADHRNDPAAIARWTANKTPDGIRNMLANAAARLFLAERDGVAAAVGCILEPREIGLNYVHPDHRFAGVSKALLAAMEAALGPGEATLASTTTAHRFYLAAGWEDAGPPEERFEMTCHPMRKML